MRSDVEGFLYPVVEMEACVKCGLCEEVCPLNQQTDSTTHVIYDDTVVYAVKHQNEAVRACSSSGGVFTAVSDLVLEGGGVIYGAAFDTSFKIGHRKAETSAERDAFRKAKYVQSDLKNTFSEIQGFLKAGRTVLFTGTPCQVAGLNGFLRQEYCHLITCDLVCHGVPSPKLFSDYCAFVEKKYRSKLKQYDFRPKSKGWRDYNPTASFENGEKIGGTFVLNTFIKIFFTHLAFRPACYSCKYTSFNRPADLTLADFWGVEQHYPAFDDNRGISLLLINSSKGQEAFEKIKGQFFYIKSTKQACMQQNLHSPSQPRGDRNIFWQKYVEYGFDYAAEKYGGYNRFSICKEIIKKTLKKIQLYSL
jgi:coenzyme F420-reducing hydrogenase beta subunit